ncbi:hypothetical protein [Pseudomonas sp. AMR01]|uniref:hypothetical protein n=1 Tax=Pseudomonas sp. AMR01 TaxID=3064904 RepID=UPI0035C099F3
MSYFDEEIIEDFKKTSAKLTILPESEHDFIVNAINEKFPFAGNRIAWDSLKDSTYFGTTASQGALESLTKKIIRVSGDCILVVGDSTDNAYSTSNVALALQIFSTIPQHTYIVSESISWIACISFEGDLDFASLY